MNSKFLCWCCFYCWRYRCYFFVVVRNWRRLCVLIFFFYLLLFSFLFFIIDEIFFNFRQLSFLKLINVGQRFLVNLISGDFFYGLLYDLFGFWYFLVFLDAPYLLQEGKIYNFISANISIPGYLQTRAVYFLMNIHITPRSIYLTRVRILTLLYIAILLRSEEGKYSVFFEK